MSNLYDYNKEYFRYLEDNWTKVSFDIISKITLNVLDRFQKSKLNTILDLGCGPGVYFPVLSKYSDNVAGIDNSDSAIELCKKNHNYKYLAVANALELPFGDNSIDFIFTSEVIEHIENTSKLFAELNRILNINGQIVLTTTLYYGSIWVFWSQCKILQLNIFKRVLGFISYISGYFNSDIQKNFVLKWCFETLGGHFHGFKRKQLINQLKYSGFKVIYWKRFYAIEPIPLLDGGDLHYVLKKRFPENILLFPVSIFIKLSNKLLKFLGICSNNIFIYASKV